MGHVSLRNYFILFFIYFLILFFNYFKWTRVNLAMCNVSESIFYIQFDHIFVIFI